MSAPKCFILFVFIVQLVENLVTCMPVDENKNAESLNYRYDNPYFRGGQIDGGFDGSKWGGHRPPPPTGPLEPGFDPNTGYVPIGTGYIPPMGGGGTAPGTGGGFDPGFDGSGLGGSGGSGGGTGGSMGGGGFDNGFDGSNFKPPGIIGGFDTGFDGSHLGGRPSGGFDGGFDGSHLGKPGGSLVQTPNFDVRSG